MPTNEAGPGSAIGVEDNQLLSAFSGNDENFQDNSTTNTDNSQDNDGNDLLSDNFSDNNTELLSDNFSNNTDNSQDNDDNSDHQSNNDDNIVGSTVGNDDNNIGNDFSDTEDSHNTNSQNDALASYNDTEVDTEIEDSFNVSAGNREYKLDFGGGHGAAAAGAGGAASVAFVDQSVNGNIWAGDDVDIEGDNEVVQATGAESWAAGDDINYDVNASTNIGNGVFNGGEVYVNNNITEVDIDDSFNWTDNSTHTKIDVDIDDSFNTNTWNTSVDDHSWKVEIEDSFTNEQEWKTVTEFDTDIEVDIEDVNIAGDDVIELDF